MPTIQHITVFDPATGILRQASGLRRGDTIARIQALGGEADEFRAVVRLDPERIAPWVSKSGNTVVVFTRRPDPRDEWEPAKPHQNGTANTRRFRCTDCGRESNAGGIALHIKSSGHAGSVPISAPVNVVKA